MGNNRIKKNYVLQCLDEFTGVSRKQSGTFLESALFIEEMFGIVLTDDEICEENLGDKHLEDFVLKKLGF